MSNYDNKHHCNNCTGENEIVVVSMDGGYISECDTKCIKCGYANYWAYGYFQYRYNYNLENIIYKLTAIVAASVFVAATINFFTWLVVS